MTAWPVRGVLLALAFCSTSCGGQKIVTITFPKMDGNSEYWVCDRDATNCHGRGEGDVDPKFYKPGLDTLSPPIECDHGAAKIEIVIKGNQVSQIGYECSKPLVPTGLPSAPAEKEDGPTGLPDAPAGPPDEAPAEATPAALPAEEGTP